MFLDSKVEEEFAAIVQFLLLMSSAMDKAMMAMSLEEEDLPFDMPDLPQFSSCEKNVLSLVGRLLNPQHQNMSRFILNMPRKWQKIGRVRGVALSKEKFQFIFRSEHDLVEVLEKGFPTFNEWGILMERWSETPSTESLQFTHLWVQIRNIPLNYYTEQAITLLGDLVGQVTEVVFDPDKPQNKDFVRVLVKFDVSKPLRKSKVVNLPKGLSDSVYYFYERVQKRCYRCQRLTHEQEDCPLKIKQIQDQIIDRKMGKKVEKAKLPLMLKEGDPLFGVLNEDQVGIHPLLGRPRIAPDVLEGMRQYLLVVSGEERKIRECRVKSSVADAENDPVAQKTVLRLEPAPIISKDFKKGKGIVFGYESVEGSSRDVSLLGQPADVLESVDSGVKVRPSPSPMGTDWVSNSLVEYSYSSSLSTPSSTAYEVGFSEVGPSGTKQRKSRGRKRPYISKRKPKPLVNLDASGGVNKMEGLEVGVLDKRKGLMESCGVQKVAKRNKNEIVPKEELSKI